MAVGFGKQSPVEETADVKCVIVGTGRLWDTRNEQAKRDVCRFCTGLNQQALHASNPAICPRVHMYIMPHVGDLWEASGSAAAQVVALCDGH